MDKILQIKNLDFSYEGVEVLRGLNLEIQKSKFVALVGENGAGKSTLLSLILGELKALGGRIILFGEDLSTETSYSKMAYISQNAVSFYKNFPTTVEEVVKLHLKHLKSKLSLDEGLAMMKLEHHKKNALNELSGGQLQKVAILLALIKKAEFIILDEATSGVDSKFSIELFKELKKLSNQGCTILMVTHHLEEALEYVDEVVRIENKGARLIPKKEVKGGEHGRF